jgi:hypothetical protein
MYLRCDGAVVMHYLGRAHEVHGSILVSGSILKGEGPKGS